MSTVVGKMFGQKEKKTELKKNISLVKIFFG